MNDALPLSSIFAAVAGLLGLVVGAILSHAFALQRERGQKKREIKLVHLIEAWRNIYVASQDYVEIERKAPALERGITDVSLFGSKAQIEMARTIAKEITIKGSSNTTALLNALRDDIRNELRLEKASDEPFFFTIKPRSHLANISKSGESV